MNVNADANANVAVDVDVDVDVLGGVNGLPLHAAALLPRPSNIDPSRSLRAQLNRGNSGGFDESSVDQWTVVVRAGGLGDR